MESCGGCASPVNGVGRGVLPGGGVRDGVHHLQLLLPGAGLLRGCLPRESAAATTASGFAVHGSNGRAKARVARALGRDDGNSGGGGGGKPRDPASFEL